MVLRVDALGDACPIPVVKAKAAVRELDGPGTVEILVDNEIAVQNLEKMARQEGWEVLSAKEAEDRFLVAMEVDGGDASPVEEEEAEDPSPVRRDVVVAVGSNVMGTGDDALGAVLMKSFLFALGQQDELPSTVLFFNGGARLTTTGSASLDDLRALEAAGVEILTCGTCLDHYGLKDDLQVGGVTNMYAIVEKLTRAGTVVRP